MSSRRRRHLRYYYTYPILFDGAYLNTLYTGQSNSVRMFNDPDNVADPDEGIAAYNSTIESLMSGITSRSVNGASGSSAMFKSTADAQSLSNYFIDDTGASWVDGNALTAAITAYDNSGYGQLGLVRIRLGNSDALVTGIEDDLVTGYRWLVNRFRQEYGPVRVYIDPLGREANSRNAGAEQSRSATIRAIDQALGIYEGSCYYDFAYVDDRHLDKTYDDLGTRDARQVARDAGYSVTGNIYGPKLVSATCTNEVITATAQTENAATLTGTTDITVYDSEGNTKTVSSISCSGQTITITLSDIAGEDVIIDPAYQSMSGYTIATAVQDNSAQTLPLRPHEVTAPYTFSIEDLTGLVLYTDYDTNEFDTVNNVWPAVVGNDFIMDDGSDEPTNNATSGVTWPTADIALQSDLGLDNITALTVVMAYYHPEGATGTNTIFAVGTGNSGSAQFWARTDGSFARTEANAIESGAFTLTTGMNIIQLRLNSLSSIETGANLADFSTPEASFDPSDTINTILSADLWLGSRSAASNTAQIGAGVAGVIVINGAASDAVINAVSAALASRYGATLS